jgi:hypothetical protein
MEQSGHIKSETAILSEDECSVARNFADAVARKPFMLADLAQKAGKSIVEMGEWAEVLRLDIELVGDSVFMDVVSEELLMDAIQSNHSDISVYRAAAFAQDRDLQSLKKLSRTKIVRNSPVARGLTECWIKSLECVSDFNLSLLLDVHPDFRLEIIEYLITEKQIVFDESIPEELLKDASPEIGFLIECSKVLSLKKWKNLSRMIEIAETLLLETGALPHHLCDHSLIKSLSLEMSQLEFVRALKIPKNQLKSISDRIERVLPKSVAPDVLRYEAGQIDVLFGDDAVFVEDGWELVMSDYLQKVGISWIEPQHLQGWKPTNKELKKMKDGDLSPLLTIKRVVQETIRSIGTLRTSDDEAVVLGLLCATSTEVSRLEDLLGDIPKKMSRF